LTCGPNKVIGELHDPMPVILAEIDWPKWLGEELASEQQLLAPQTMPGRGIENLAGRQNERQRKKTMGSLSNEVPV
jgi:putative SOS response-associated peptidase YedK